MKHPALRLAFLGMATLLIAACAAAPRRVPFNEAEFIPTSGKGTGTVVGRAYATTKDGVTHYAQRSLMDMVPVNAYTTETDQRRFINGEKLAAGDPRYEKYIRSVWTDENGDFVFHNIPPGDYYIGGEVVWHFPSEMYVNASDGTSSAEPIEGSASHLVHGRVTVRNGQTSRVDVTW